MDHSTIRMLLLSSGWKEKEIAQALSAEGLDMPVPTPPDVGGAREAFLHLLSFAALYTMVISLIILFFYYINRAFPDLATDYAYTSDADFSGIRWSMAAVIVAFPLLLWMSRMIHKDIALYPQKAWSGIRRWLTYITLFVAASTLMVDVITLIFSLLNGELSIRFLLKVFVVFALAGLTFTYYFLSLKRTEKASRNLNKTFLIAGSAITVLAIVWGALIVGSPAKERSHKFDERRLQDLRGIQSEIFSIVYDESSQKSPVPVAVVPAPVNPLPKTLDDVVSQAVYQRPVIVDPETGSPYEYIVKDALRFDLCATFNFVRDESYDIFWNHGAGNQCFEFDVSQRNYY